ncbi:hypothetical protein J4216_00395 [Candidatus Woesearchaeota archaeon]|nr:hypothetical protein [Candidatus Woesearchaeota archaeon]
MSEINIECGNDLLEHLPKYWRVVVDSNLDRTQRRPFQEVRIEEFYACDSCKGLHSSIQVQSAYDPARISYVNCARRNDSFEANVHGVLIGRVILPDLDSRIQIFEDSRRPTLIYQQTSFGIAPVDLEVDRILEYDSMQSTFSGRGMQFSLNGVLFIFS